jgi:hypothetical protein
MLIREQFVTLSLFCTVAAVYYENCLPAVHNHCLTCDFESVCSIHTLCSPLGSIMPTSLYSNQTFPLVAFIGHTFQEMHNHVSAYQLQYHCIFFSSWTFWCYKRLSVKRLLKWQTGTVFSKADYKCDKLQNLKRKFLNFISMPYSIISYNNSVGMELCFIRIMG